MSFPDQGFSLVMGTLGKRPELLVRFLDHLALQIGQGVDVELIIVEQSPTPWLWDSVLSSWRYHSRVIYRAVNWYGLSAARNFGLALATKPFVAFPDDDCFYPPNLLVNIGSLLQDGFEVVGVAYGPQASWSPAEYRVKILDRRSERLLFAVPSVGLFFRRQVFDRIGTFDERLGLGSRIGAGEETDLLIRAYLGGCKIAYATGLTVGHPQFNPTKLNSRVGRAYGLGFGVVCRRYVKHLPVTISTLFLERCCVDIASAIIRGAFSFRWNRFAYDVSKLSGRVLGFLSGGRRDRSVQEMPVA